MRILERKDAEPRGRVDRDSRREAILDVAETIFLDVGYSAASMSMIAAKVGGSKGTLYNYFRSKQELFEAYIDRHCAWQQQAMDELLAQDGDVRHILQGVGEALLSVVLSDFGVRNFTLVVSESGRAPEIGRAYYEAGPRRGVGHLAEFIARASRDGRLRPCDPMAAAFQFSGLCQVRLLKARLCNVLPEPTPEELRAEAAAAVETFMAAHGPL